MTTSNNIHRPFGPTGIVVPLIAFRADVLDNSARDFPEKTKRLICGEWLRRIEPPVLIDVDLDEKRNLHLSALGRLLTHFDVTPDEVIINIKLETLGDSPNSDGPYSIRAQFDNACDLLGKNYVPRMVTLPIARPADAFEWLHALQALKTLHQLAVVGIALHDWRLGQTILDVSHVDFIKLLNGPTVLQHPLEMLKWLADLAARQIPVITGGVFDGGFLVGGPIFDGRLVNSDAPADQSLVTWRKAFTSLCHGHGVRPAHACIQFALSRPGIVAASLKTSNVDRVAEDVYAAMMPVPSGLWASMTEEGLFAHHHGDALT